MTKSTVPDLDVVLGLIYVDVDFVLGLMSMTSSSIASRIPWLNADEFVYMPKWQKAP